MRIAYINCTVFTSDFDNKWADCFIVNNDKFEKVGYYNELKNIVSGCEVVIDLNSKLVLPGFIDSHAHLEIGGTSLLNIDFSEVRSKSEFERKIADAKKNKDLWILGGNWDHQLFDDKILPSIDWLDPYTEDIPAFFTRTDLHMGVANSAALKIAGINEETLSPDGGLIEVKEGRLTGILKDNAMKLITNVIPVLTESQKLQAFNSAFNYASENGVTSVFDMILKQKSDAVKYYQNFKNRKLRIFCCHPLSDLDKFKDLSVCHNFGDSGLKIGALKAFADGSLGSKTAWFFEEYNNEPSNFGLPMQELVSGEMEDLMIEADKCKLQLIIHAIGDRAVHEVINIFQKISEINPSWDRRHRIEHVQHISKMDLIRMAELGIVASVQPQHLFDDGSWFENFIGNERINEAFKFRSFIKYNVKYCFGSDWTVAPMKPISGIYSAVTRQTRDGKNPNGINPSEKISVEEAVLGYTINGAFAAYQENFVGSVKAGKQADFVVLDKNIFNIHPAEIKDTQVIKTFFNGELIYEK